MNTTRQTLWRATFLLTFFVAALFATAQTSADTAETISDTLATADDEPAPSRWGFSLNANPSWQMAMDKRVKQWLRKKQTFTIAAELHHMALPTDNDAFASDFGYPTITAGVRYAVNNQVRMHLQRYAELNGESVDVTAPYESRLGNTISAYAAFARPLLRTPHWEADYALNIGLGYSHLKYNPHNDIDNELIGAHVLIYFGAGLHLTYHPVPEWGVRAGLEFVHHSNGALNRPNKGSNAVGPTLGIVYTPYYEAVSNHPLRLRPDFEKQWLLNFTLGVGAKTLLEDWNITQYHLPADDPDYATEHFRLYAAYSLQADVMRRYARRWASGVGLDLYYGTYYKRSREVDHFYNFMGEKYSPWSVGLALKHNVYYHNWSANMAFGFYLFRRMGREMTASETPYYERIGVHYHFPRLGGLSVGANVHAHLGKANFTELAVGMPITL